ATEESHENGLLEYPQYTQPREFQGLKVPDVLLSGHKAKIDDWRLTQSLILTRKHRPDMYEKYELDKKRKSFLKNMINNKKPQPLNWVAVFLCLFCGRSKVKLLTINLIDVNVINNVLVCGVPIVGTKNRVITG
ncbi:MAG: hypothetical protein J6Q76_08135, partial [Clostridia bacterium]|nr:hypothetical protein [Clostridia bacterium]